MDTSLLQLLEKCWQGHMGHIIYGHWFCSRFIGLCQRDLLDLLACWKGGFGRHQNVDIWNAIPLCIMWTIWKERNNCTFEQSPLELKQFPYALCMMGWFDGTERSPLKLKLFFLCSMFDWKAALSGHSFSNLVKFLDLCNDAEEIWMHSKKERD